jgi:HSP20 family protein
MRRAFDRMFDSALLESSDFDSDRTMSLALDVAETQDEFIVKASIPGINPENLDITYSDNLLTIKGETQEESEINEGKYHMRERRFGSFMRSVTIPGVKADEINAQYDKGILALHLPKAEESKPKRIEIKSPKMIEGEMKDK